MPTTPREWPNNAKQARDAAAEEAAIAIRNLQPLMEGGLMTNEERIRRLANALIAMHKIQRIMAQVGAPVRDV